MLEGPKRMEENNREVVITFCDLLEGRQTDIFLLIYVLLSSYPDCFIDWCTGQERSSARSPS
jgi:hypothetical protein